MKLMKLFLKPVPEKISLKEKHFFWLVGSLQKNVFSLPNSFFSFEIGPHKMKHELLELCAYPNHTFVVVSITKEIMSIEGRNTITGQMGRCLDKMLCSKAKRKCKIIGKTNLKTKDPFFKTFKL